METPLSNNEAARRALAVEGTLLQLVNRLAELGLINLDDARTMLEQLAKSSDYSATRVAPSFAKLDRLQALRGGASDITPGADIAR